MLQNDYAGAFVLGFSLNDPWMEILKQATLQLFFMTTIFPPILYRFYRN